MTTLVRTLATMAAIGLGFVSISSSAEEATPTPTPSAPAIASGIVAEARLPVGELYLNQFQSSVNPAAPYSPVQPYGYVGYRLSSGINVGLGIGLDIFNFGETAGGTTTSGSGWILGLDPTIKIPLAILKNVEISGVARFLFAVGQSTSAIPSESLPAGATGNVTTPLLQLGGNLGSTCIWYPEPHFGLGAEIGFAFANLSGTATPTVAGMASPGTSIDAWYIQAYAALLATYIL